MLIFDRCMQVVNLQPQPRRSFLVRLGLRLLSAFSH